MVGGTAETFDERLPNSSQKNDLETGLILVRGWFYMLLRRGI